jgi:hypothetical protein
MTISRQMHTFIIAANQMSYKIMNLTEDFLVNL